MSNDFFLFYLTTEISLTVWIPEYSGPPHPYSSDDWETAIIPSFHRHNLFIELIAHRTKLFIPWRHSLTEAHQGDTFLTYLSLSP